MSSPLPKYVAGSGISGLIILALALLFQVQSTDLYRNVFPASVPAENKMETYYNVTKVIDGDTLHVDLDGVDEKVRLIGINTPETVDKRKTVQCFGKESSARMEELADGKIVRLEYDDTQSKRDAYDRILAYVYLEDGQMLNRKMVAEGYAYEYTYMIPYKYQKEFRQLQNLAKTSLRGLWAKETCDGKK